MRVSMEYFMKRRNLKWASFLGMSYDRYVKWCHVRRIVPASEEEFTEGTSPAPEPDLVVPEELPRNPAHSNAKLLNKNKKANLVDIAKLYGVELSGSETKKQLVQLIVDVNNSL